MDPEIINMILILVNIGIAAITPIIKCITRVQKSKCLGGEVEFMV